MLINSMHTGTCEFGRDQHQEITRARAMAAEEAQAGSVHIFYSYAHDDEKFRNELHNHFGLLRQQRLITEWYDRDIDAGADWKDQIDNHLNMAHIILLLISADFIASEYCYSIEMQRALERHQSGSARVIPILLRPANWEEAPFAKLQVLPRNKEAISTWENQDLAYTEIAIAIRAIVERRKNDSSDLADFTESTDPQTHSDSSGHQHIEVPVLRGSTGEGIRIPTDVLNALENLSRCQQRVSELKSVHHMLHEIEQSLVGLTGTIQIPLLIDSNTEKVATFKAVKNLLQQVRQKINNLALFAAEEMIALEEERLVFNSGGVQGPFWVTELLAAQYAFEASMKEQNVKEMDMRAAELLDKCDSHLYLIDRRLLKAVKEVESILDHILRSVR